MSDKEECVSCDEMRICTCDLMGKPLCETCRKLWKKEIVGKVSE